MHHEFEVKEHHMNLAVAPLTPDVAASHHHQPVL